MYVVYLYIYLLVYNVYTYDILIKSGLRYEYTMYTYTSVSKVIKVVYLYTKNSYNVNIYSLQDLILLMLYTFMRLCLIATLC